MKKSDFDPSVSEAFQKAFDSRGCGSVRQCACGRIHFDARESDWDWDEGEYEGYEKGAKKEPDKYFPRDGSVGTMIVLGREIVYGCGCGEAARIERCLIKHENDLLVWFEERRKGLLEVAADANETVERIGTLLKQG